MANIYMAASYARKMEIRQYRDELTIFGHVITSRWLDRDGDIDCSQARLNVEYDSLYVQGLLNEDIDDIFRSNCFFMFTGDDKSWGGRHTEFGIAVGLFCIEKIIIIGPRENIFQCTPRVAATFPDWNTFIIELAKTHEFRNIVKEINI
jgi:hypothetical protein